MPINWLKKQTGFTLIELLAVMAIVAVLAGIVSVAVGGTGETSKDTQTKQDATTVDAAVADFFSDQEGADVLTPSSEPVLDLGPFQQITSSKWPEEYISVAYAEVFPPTTTGTVSSVTFKTESGTISTITLGELLTNFNAVDFDALITGDFLATEPDGAKLLTDNRYSNYLWLLQKTTAAGGSDGAARQIVVFKLQSIQKNEVDDQVDLTYVQLVGEFTVASDILANILVDEDAPDSVIPLEGFFTSVTVTGNDNPGLVAADFTGTDLILSYQPEQSGESTITVLGTLINGEFAEISFLVTVDAINDPPLFAIVNPAPVSVVAGAQTVEITGVSSGPNETESVTFTVSLLSDPTDFVINDLSITGTTISYTPSNVGLAVIQVVANDGQSSANSTTTKSLEVEVVAPLITTSIVVPNALENTEADNSAGSPFNLGSGEVRFQQRYPASQFASITGGTALVTSIAFRPDLGGGAFDRTIINSEFRLATIPSSQTDLSLNFDNNLNNAVLVHSGDLRLNSFFVNEPSGTSKQFDVIIDLQTPFLYNPATDDLVLEVKFPKNSLAATSVMDAAGVADVPLGLSRLVVADFDGPAGSLSQGGLVTKFTFAVTSGTAVLPSSFENVEGGQESTTPFNLLTADWRSQHLYPAAMFTQLPSSPVLITKVAFRTDGPGGFVFSASETGASIQIATIAPGGLSTTFLDNIPISTRVTVHDATSTLTLSSSNTSANGTTNRFDIVIDLATPFLYKPADGDLVLDFVFPTGSGLIPGSAVDAVLNEGLSRVFSEDAAGAFGFPDQLGLVTQFTYELP